MSTAVINPAFTRKASDKSRIKQAAIFFLLLAAMFFIVVSSTHAGAGGTEFDEVWLTLKDWTQGTLGRIIAGAMIIVGIMGGIARQSLIAFALGIGGGIGLYNAPIIIESIMSATLEHAGTITAAASQIGNGLGM
ncbi:TraA family conjugative transfer protein [Eoetvoesiella caeni]